MYLRKFVLSVLTLDHIENVFLRFFILYGHGDLDLKIVHRRAEKHVGSSKVLSKKGVHI